MKPGILVVSRAQPRALRVQKFLSLQDAGAAAAWFPALTTMAGLQANWDFLSDFRQRGTLALDALRAQAAQSPWGIASNGRILNEPRLRAMEEMYLPD